MAKRTTFQVTLDGLVEAREFIKKGWTQEWFARDADGNQCDSGSRQATCWCVTGAIGRTIKGGNAYSLAIDELERTTKNDNIVQWNDDPDRTQGDVVSAFTRTIARMRRQKKAK